MYQQRVHKPIANDGSDRSELIARYPEHVGFIACRATGVVTVIDESPLCHVDVTEGSKGTQHEERSDEDQNADLPFAVAGNHLSHDVLAAYKEQYEVYAVKQIIEERALEPHRLRDDL